MNNKKPLPSFGRRKGRKLRTGKQSLLDTLLPKLQLSLEELGNWGTEELGKKIFSNSPNLQFANSPIPLWLEIGFGGGEHLAHQATLHPEIGIIGCEPYVNGIGDLLRQIFPLPLGEGAPKERVRADSNEALIPTFSQREKGLSNIRIFPDDARLLIEKLPDVSLERVFMLYPDPWPKARHHKRRLVSSEFLSALARVMKPGAQLRLATDHSDYATWMLERLLIHPDFTWTAKDCNDWLNPPAEWIPTKYEQKALAGRPTYLNFKRI